MCHDSQNTIGFEHVAYFLKIYCRLVKMLDTFGGKNNIKNSLWNIGIENRIIIYAGNTAFFK